MPKGALSTVIALILALVPCAARADDEAESVFESRVRPMLAESCFRCHGGEKTAHGLRVDSREALLKGGKTGPAIVPGKPEASLLVIALEHRDEAEFQMPPDARLPDETLAAVTSWIRQGAPWPADAAGKNAFSHKGHWAYQPVVDMEPPVDTAPWSDHPIDRFIAAGWKQQHLQRVAQADRRTLIRRLYFDLVGLPPSPEEVDSFLRDDSPDAWTRWIDRLLASSQYGERWGRYWMDVVRYADTAGDNADYPVPEARLYRDYIIDSFNADKPYDQFVREQMAGDLLAAQSLRDGKSAERFAEQTIATGFLALSRRYATAPYELWHLTLEDTIDTVGRAFLGQTFKCARCHDHKFDPITQEDYYALYGIFSATRFPWAGGEEFASKQFGRKHFAPLVPPEEALPKIVALNDELASLDSQIKQFEQEGAKDKADPLKAQRRDLLRTSVPAEVPCAYAVSEGEPVDVPLQQKGDPAQPGPVVPRGMPKFVAGVPAEPISAGESGRLQLALWLTHPEHPLTARVIVNRVWQQHFGKGIVATPSNFGTRGDAPTHPELLDYLARRFVRSGWSIKALHRLILTSKTWQLASVEEVDCARIDPDNHYYWRFDRQRLDAEAIRDSLLSVAGTLDTSRPGLHPFPEIKTWGWTQHTPFKDVYPSSHRSVYLMTQRIQKHPFLALFDGPDTNTTTDQRTRSTVPLQALFWMNSPFVREQSAALARRIIGEETSPESRLRRLFAMAYSREPLPEEMDRYVEFATRYEDELRKSGQDPEKINLETWASLVRTVLSSNEFVYVD